MALKNVDAPTDAYVFCLVYEKITAQKTPFINVLFLGNYGNICLLIKPNVSMP